MVCQILRITDGTDIADFLNLTTGIHLDNWNPQIQQPKDGGTFQDSPFSPGRRRVYSQFANAIETFTFKVNGLTRNQTLQHVTDLIDLLEKAVQYWETDYQSTPVYLEVQTADGNTQYCCVKSYTFLELDNPFAQPFFTGSNSPTLDELNLDIERGEWLDNIPGQSEALSILVRDSEYSSSDITFFANYHIYNDLTHIYVDDGGVFGANQVASTAFSLLPASPAINDAVYFGNEDGYQFTNLIFDLNDVFAGTSVNGVWERYDGSWTAISDPVDDTDGFETSGVNSVAWQHDATDTTVSINGTSGYWIRFRVTAATGVTDVPTQQNRIVYTQNVPYIELPSTIVTKLPALAKLQATTEWIKTLVVGERFERSLIIGSRLLSRGSNFTAHLNVSDVQEPTNIDVTVGTDSSFVSSFTFPTGRAVRFTPIDNTNIERATIEIGSSLAQEFQGRYLAFLLSQSSGITEFAITIAVRVGGYDISLFETSPVSFSSFQTSITDQQIITPLGKLDILPEEILSASETIEIGIVVEAADTNNTLDLVTLVIIPTDEMAEFISINTGSLIGGSTDSYWETSSLNPKRPLDRMRYLSDDSIKAIAFSQRNSLFGVEASQRLWTLTLENASRTLTEFLHRASMEINTRFLSLRGDL